MAIRPFILWEVLTALAAFCGLAALVGLGERLRAWGVSSAATRRLVHIGVGLFVAATPLLFARPLPVYLLAIVFTGLNGAARARCWWDSLHAARPQSWGTVALPLSVLPLLAATWSVSPDRLFAFQGAYLVLALADPAAAWVGERASRADEASPAATVSGSLTFAALTLGLLLLVLGGLTPWPGDWVVSGAVLATVVATSVEAVGRRGWDNLFVPVALLLVLIPLHEATTGIAAVSGALAAGAAFGGLSYWAGALDRDGAVTGGLFAASLVALGGLAWVGPGLVFFGLSSALSHVRRVWQGEREGGSPRRTQAQVLANGGVAWAVLAVVAIVPSGARVATGGYAAFVGALAAAAADTWATEVGTLSATAPWSLRTGRSVPRGTSGAVSVLGTGAAGLGAASVAGGAILAGGTVTGPVLWDAGLFVGAGLVGMGADSLAGAFLQAQYRTARGAWVESPPASGRRPTRGWAPVGNNIVNLIGTTLGAVTPLVILFLMGEWL